MRYEVNTKQRSRDRSLNSLLSESRIPCLKADDRRPGRLWQLTQDMGYFPYSTGFQRDISFCEDRGLRHLTAALSTSNHLAAFLELGF